MTRLHYVKKAMKDYVDAGIKKGTSYYWWSFKFGAKHRSAGKPKPSQLTQSEFLSAVYDVDETLSGVSTGDEFEFVISEAIDALESLRDETEDKLSNMPEQLQEGDTGQLMQGRIDSVQEMIDELEGIDATMDEGSIKDGFDEDEDFDDAIEQRKEEISEEIRNISYGGE